MRNLPTVRPPHNESIMGMNEATHPAAGTHRAPSKDSAETILWCVWQVSSRLDVQKNERTKHKEKVVQLKEKKLAWHVDRRLTGVTLVQETQQ